MKNKIIESLARLALGALRVISFILTAILYLAGLAWKFIKPHIPEILVTLFMAWTATLAAAGLGQPIPFLATYMALCVVRWIFKAAKPPKVQAPENRLLKHLVAQMPLPQARQL